MGGLIPPGFVTENESVKHCVYGYKAAVPEPPPDVQSSIAPFAAPFVIWPFVPQPAKIKKYVGIL